MAKTKKETSKNDIPDEVLEHIKKRTGSKIFALVVASENGVSISANVEGELKQAVELLRGLDSAQKQITEMMAEKVMTGLGNLIDSLEKKAKK